MGQMKIKNSKTGKIVGELHDEPDEIYIIDETTGKKYTLTEWQNLKDDGDAD